MLVVVHWHSVQIGRIKSTFYASVLYGRPLILIDLLEAVM